MKTIIMKTMIHECSRKNKKVITKNTIVKIVTVLLLASAALSCSPEDGKNGVNGTNGTSGAAGTNGINGTNGTNGQTGTANVIYSNWFPANFVATGSAYYFTIPLPTSIPYTNILNTYHVAMYYDNGSLHQLPMKDFNLNAEFSFTVFSGGFRVQVARAGVTTPDIISSVVGTSTSDRLRYVLIPGGVNISGRGTSQPDYTKMSYHEICSKFNIPK